MCQTSDTTWAILSVSRPVASLTAYWLQNKNRFLVILWIINVILSEISAQNTDSPPKRFINQPQTGSPHVEGNSKVLICQTDGVPAAVYRWRHDNQYLLPGNTTEGSLRLTNLQRSDAGEYQCIASNRLGAILSSRANVYIAYLVPFTAGARIQEAVELGRARVITLPPIDSFPAPSVQWYNEGTPISQDSLRYYVTTSNQLVILQAIDSDHRKQFTAHATNSHTGTMSASKMYELNVQGNSSVGDVLPEMVIAPQDTSATQGREAVVFECVINARPLNYLSIRWYRILDDSTKVPIEQTTFKYLLSQYQRTLTVKNVVDSDAGFYECQGIFAAPGTALAASGAQPISARANLSVLTPPYFRRPPTSDTRREQGSDVIIPCEADGVPTPAVTWYRNAVPINFTASYSLVESRNLQISRLALSDTAMYQCFASSVAGEIHAAMWLVVYSSAPEIQTPPQNATSIAGSSVLLKCEVIGAPRPTVVWTREFADGRVETVNASSRVRITEQELSFSATQRDNSALYTCTATNNIGRASASAWLVVITRTRIVQPPQDSAVILGSTKLLLCEVESDPTVIVSWTWYHQGTPISPDTRRTIRADGTLEIKSVRNNDIGMYRCEVQSSGGDAQAQANITVVQLPYAPAITSVALNADISRAVDVAWTPGFDGNIPIIKFTVEYRLAPPGEALHPADGWILADANILASRRSSTVRGLTPAQFYQFRVAAVNSVGVGPGSEPSAAVQIPQEPPSGPPLGVVASPRSETSVLVQWQYPSPDHWNGDLTGYTVRYKPANYPDSTLAYENISNYLVTIYELRGLIVFQEYEIAVAAMNDEGIGVYSGYTRVRTHEGRPDVAPTNVVGTAINSTAVEMAWNPPDAQFINGINQGYKFEAVRSGSNGSEPAIRVTVPSNTSNLLGRQRAAVGGLRKFSHYQLRVLCFTSRGDGPYSAPITVQTMEDVPEQVGSVEFTDIRDTSVNVTWTPPVNINGVLTGYTLRYMLKGQPLTVITRALPPPQTSYRIAELTAMTEYTVEVLASTRAGPGPARRADIQSGRTPELPEPPRNLTITYIDSAYILLQFIPGFSGYTSISKWIVEAQTGARAKREAPEQELTRFRRQTSGEWYVVFETSHPEARSLTVTNLTPYTRYRLRIRAENIRGASEASEATHWFQTTQAAPAQPPSDITIRAVDQTSVRVTWTPLSPELWYGEDRGYRLEFKRGTSDSAPYDTIRELLDPTANSLVLRSLQEYMRYTVRVAAYNGVGSSRYSVPVFDTTREAEPSAGPTNVSAEQINSTSIRVTWGEVPLLEQNGQIDGYGVLYKLLGEVNSTVEEWRVSVVNATVVSGLKKYREYLLQVRAYTIGPGALSNPPLVVRTHEDVPGPPASVYFPEVTWTTARIVWSAPSEPNGVITAYRVSYRQEEDSPASTVTDDQIAAGVREKYVSGLSRDRYYVFSIAARTGLGWGTPAELRLRTVVNRRAPDPPERPTIQQPQIGDRHVMMQWQPRNDNYSPVRNFTIQYQRESEPWATVAEYVPHDLTAFAVTGLKPNTRYRFRIAATNDVGTSEFSNASDQITTKQAAPESAPVNLTVTPQTRTSVNVTWQPPPADTWNGELLGYNLEYRELDSPDSWTTETVYNPQLDELHLSTLQLFHTYEFRVRAFNLFGESPWSAVLVVYIEIVPTGAPRAVTASALSSTEIQLSWQPPPVEEQNGDLLGYEIFYWRTQEGAENSTQTTVVAGSETDAVLSGLRKYTQYSAVLLAFNAAGEGPNSTQIANTTTLEDTPSAPGALYFRVTSSTSVNVSWALPNQTNGVITQYSVSYYQDSYVDGERLSVQVDVQAGRQYYYASELVEGVKYVFSVKARTSVDWGPSVTGEITVGPQPGSPAPPSRVSVEVQSSSLRLTWVNVDEGDSPISGYIIQARRKGESQWHDEVTSNTLEPELSLPLSNLRTNSYYQFRVIALNAHGPSEPSEPTEFYHVKDKSNEEPFYRQWWFLVIVALLGVIFIIIVISLLCLTGRNARNKHKHPLDRIPHTTLQLTPAAANMPDHTQLPYMEQDIENDDGLVTVTSRRSGRHQQSGRGRGFSSRRSEVSLPPYSRHPPRPSPGLVNYEDDTETQKSYAESEASDITDKPSDPSDSDNDSQQSESDHGLRAGAYGGAVGGGAHSSHSTQQQPHSFSTAYVSNGDVRNSWKRRARGPSAHAQYANQYTDSEHDSSHYAQSLNGAVLMMNNMAGSRAPLPGFSSFV